MKTVSLAVLSFVMLSAFTSAPKPKLLPAVEQFYKELQSVKADPKHAAALYNVKSFILQGMGVDKPIALLLESEDNSFTDLSAQIVLQSLLSVEKFNKLLVYSTGQQPTEVNPVLIKILSKHGYVVTEAGTANGKKKYEVKFGDDVPPVIIFTKAVNEVTLPKTFFQLKLCTTNCADINGALFKESVSFGTVTASMSEDEADKLFVQIAAEMLATFNQAKP